jgi:hypothetical protein
MRSFSLSALLLSATLAAGCAQDAPTVPAADSQSTLFARSAANCENVRGTLSGNAFVPWGLTFDGDITGPGTLTAAPELDPRGNGAIHLATLHAIDTGDGMIFTTDQGVLAPVSPPVYRLINRYTISGGTDNYEGAAGFMHINALIDISTGDLEGTYHGRVCR